MPVNTEKMPRTKTAVAESSVHLLRVDFLELVAETAKSLCVNQPTVSNDQAIMDCSIVTYG